jgi:hypothetical protein
MGNGLYVEEHGAGLGKAAYQWHRAHVSVSPKSVVPKADIEAGLAWVEAMYEAAVQNQTTHLYGWVDIFDEAMQVFRQRVLLHSKSEWDCSDFCTRYLIAAGAEGPLGKLALTPQLVAPNDLAIAYHVMPHGSASHG